MNESMVIIPNLPDKLKRLRQSHGWSQGQLGNKLNVNVQLISKHERGVVCPPTNMMVKIASIPDEDQRVLTNLLDAYIKKHKFELLAQS